MSAQNADGPRWGNYAEKLDLKYIDSLRRTGWQFNRLGSILGLFFGPILGPIFIPLFRMKFSRKFCSIVWAVFRSHLVVGTYILFKYHPGQFSGRYWGDFWGQKNPIELPSRSLLQWKNPDGADRRRLRAGFCSSVCPRAQREVQGTPGAPRRY